MSLSVFGDSVLYSRFAVACASALSVLACAGLSYGFFWMLSDGEKQTRAKFLSGLIACGLLVYCLIRPVLWGGGVWPQNFDDEARLIHTIISALAAAAVFAVVGPKSAAAGQRFFGGALIGLASGLAGVYAQKLLFVSHAAAMIGHGRIAAALFAAVPVGLAVSVVVLTVLVFFPPDVGRLTRGLLVASVLFLWVIPCERAESYLAGVWDYGRGTLTEASGVPTSDSAATLGIVILADKTGLPASRYRDFVLAAEGLDVSPRSLIRLRKYLEEQGFQTIHLGRALAALRRGEKLNWEAERYMDAAAIFVEPGFPPDTLGFLDAITVAPATTENYGRLEKMGSYAWYDKIPSIKDAQKTFEGFSTAYARFGELETSNLWLDRIRGLWPLYEDDIHVEPVASSHDGRISGRLSFGGRPARELKVGLFAAPSTTTVLDASRYLVASAMPEEGGRFYFGNLLPGRYYLALQGEPFVLESELLRFRNAPGEIKLTEEDNVAELLPIEIERGLPRTPPDDGRMIAPGALPGMSRPGVGGG